MPCYGTVCPEGHRYDVYCRIADRDNPRTCMTCGGLLTRLIEAPRVLPDIPSYQSPVTGQWIDSRTARREDLASSNSMAWEPGMKADFARIREQKKEEAFSEVAKTIESTARDLVSAGHLSPL